MQKAIPNSDFESSAFFGQLMSVAIGVPFLFTESSFTSTDIWAVAVLGIVQMGLSYVFLSDRTSLGFAHNRVADIHRRAHFKSRACGDFLSRNGGVAVPFGGAVVIGSVAVYNVLKAKEGVKMDEKNLSRL